MRDLLAAETANEVKARLARLTPASERRWGTMNAAQAVAHCAVGMELALGEQRPPRLVLGRIIGAIVKPLALGTEAPMRRNSPTVPGMVITGDRDLERERARLRGLIDRFVAGGRAGCTTHPHSFFGRLTPDEWGVLMYKHLDHHLRQFGE